MKVLYFLFISQCVDSFVDKLRWEEQDFTKHDGIHGLKLISEEWKRVNTFLSLLGVCLLFVYILKSNML